MLTLSWRGGSDTTWVAKGSLLAVAYALPPLLVISLIDTRTWTIVCCEKQDLIGQRMLDSHGHSHSHASNLDNGSGEGGQHAGVHGDDAGHGVCRLLRVSLSHDCSKLALCAAFSPPQFEEHIRFHTNIYTLPPSVRCLQHQGKSHARVYKDLHVGNSETGSQGSGMAMALTDTDVRQRLDDNPTESVHLCWVAFCQSRDLLVSTW